MNISEPGMVTLGINGKPVVFDELISLKSGILFVQQMLNILFYIVMRHTICFSAIVAFWALFVTSCNKEDSPVLPDLGNPDIKIECESYLHLSFNKDQSEFNLDEIWIDFRSFEGQLPFPPGNSSAPELINIIPRKVVIPDFVKVGFKQTSSANNEFNFEAPIISYDYKSIPITSISSDLGSISYILGGSHPESVTEVIKNNMLEEIEFNTKITEIPACFTNFPNLTTVILKEPLKIIGPSAFENCPKLVNITIPASVETVGDNAFGNTGLKAIKLPVKINKLGNYVFNDCKSLETITSEMIFMSENVVQNCNSLKKVVFTANELSLSCCFRDCASLTNITSYANSPIKITRETLWAMPNGVKFHVRRSLKNLYETDSVWKNFPDLIVYEDL